MVGLLAVSMAGHDKNQVYYIVKEEKGYVYLVDGEIRLLDNPKKKNRKHVQVIKRIHVEEKDNLLHLSISNEKIKRVIKEYSKANE